MFRGNYTDYFAKKMAELKARGKLGSVPASWTAAETGQEPAGRQHSRPGFGASTSVKKSEESEQCEEEEPARKKKKSKKSQKSESVEETSECIVDAVAEDLGKKKKKSKKNKKKEE